MLRFFARKLVFGHLTIEMPDGRTMDIAAPFRPDLSATLEIKTFRALRRMLLKGALGLGESYVDGDWDSPDLPALIELVALNFDHLGKAMTGTGLQRWLNRSRHGKNANSLKGAKTNILAHYDLGNRFFASWLDPSMSYSSALFNNGAESLEEAQIAKMDHVIALLDAPAKATVLEVGCGWGGLARRIQRKTGARVTGITLSDAQYDHAVLDRPHDTSDPEFRIQDYREVTGTYDRIISIEMLEAVGEEYWSSYFQVLHDRLRPGGRAVIQTITIEDHRFDAYRTTPDFIQHHVFPGGMLPTARIVQARAADAGLTLIRDECHTASYARTLRIWRDRFQAAWPTHRPFQGDDRFFRLWNYYLGYCEGGFRAEAIELHIMAFSKPRIGDHPAT